jgi:dolichol-phosphate mannosyltransferase
MDALQTPARRDPGAPPTVERQDVLVVLPTYNEAENLRNIGTAIREHGVGVLIVDDDSPDGTGDIADSMARDDARIQVLHRRVKQGLGPAYAAGFAVGIESGAGIICEMDADFSHDPADLRRLVEAIDDGADVAIGSRYVPGGGASGWAPHRRLISMGGNWYARTMLRTSIRDMTAGFRAYRAEALMLLDPRSCEASGYGFQVEMAWRAARAEMDVREVPIVFRERREGTSKMTSAIAFEAMRLVTSWGWRRTLRR